MIGRGALAVLVIAVATLTYPGAAAVALATRFSVTPTSPGGGGDTSWLHVEHPAGQIPFIADAFGRKVILHGAIPASLVEFGGSSAPVYPIDPAAYADGRCPANVPANRYPPLCQADLAAMAEVGFNSLRLPVSWSLLEPARGHFSQLYIDRIAQVVDWARAIGMYVIVDMHQNAYSPFVGAGPSVNLAYNSGAPAWATFTDGLPSHVYGGQRELNPAVFEAATNFWYDRAGIQDEYITALGELVRRFKDDSNVAGYGVYNEPWPGWNLPPGFEDLLLFPFYRRVIDAVTGARDGLPCWSGFFMPAVCGYRDLGIHDRRQLLFLDPGLLREVTDFPTHLGLPISSYPNVVLAMHAYTHIYTLDTFIGEKPGTANYPWGGYEQSYWFAEREAKAMDSALFVSEFGNDPAYDDLILNAQLDEQDRHGLGFAFWTWRENGISGWGMFDEAPAATGGSTPCMRADRERLLARVYPRAIADPTATYAYNPDDGAFTLRSDGRRGDPATIVYVPREVTGSISIGGAATFSSVQRSDGSRTVIVTPTGGQFTVSTASGPMLTMGCL